MKFALVGPGHLGRNIFHAAAGQRLVVGEPDCDGGLAREAELGYTTRLQDAASCQTVAVTVPPGACDEIFQTLCPLMQPGSILLNFSTKWYIPDQLRQKFPQLHLLNAKLAGSAWGLSLGLGCLVVLGPADEALAEQVRSCLPGLNIMPGDYAWVENINTQATRAALLAAVGLERELTAQGVPSEMVKAVVEGLMPGVIVSYSRGTLGGFAQSIVDSIQKKSE